MHSKRKDGSFSVLCNALSVTQNIFTQRRKPHIEDSEPRWKLGRLHLPHLPGRSSDYGGEAVAICWSRLEQKLDILALFSTFEDYVCGI